MVDALVHLQWCRLIVFFSRINVLYFIYIKMFCLLMFVYPIHLHLYILYFWEKWYLVFLYSFLENNKVFIFFCKAGVLVLLMWHSNTLTHYAEICNNQTLATTPYRKESDISHGPVPLCYPIMIASHCLIFISAILQKYLFTYDASMKINAATTEHLRAESVLTPVRH